MSAFDALQSPVTDEVAAEWCVRLVGGALPEAAQTELDQWLAADPEHGASLARALQVWDGLGEVGETPELISRRADALGTLRRANQQRWAASRLFSMRREFAAAAMVLAVSAAWFLHRPHAAAGVEYATTIGERRALLLPDGSHLSLDSATRVAVDLEPDRRTLTLRAGRAKFDVAKDRARPFTVTAGESTVVATGTAFSVELLRDRVHVIVYEGAVVVTRGTMPSARELVRLKSVAMERGTALLPARELIAQTVGAPHQEVVVADTGRSLAWEAGQLDFDNEPLANAVERLNRYSTAKIVIDDRKLGGVEINGVFNAGNSLAFAGAVAEAYNLQVRREGGDLHLSRAP